MLAYTEIICMYIYRAYTCCFGGPSAKVFTQRGYDLEFWEVLCRHRVMYSLCKKFQVGAVSASYSESRAGKGGTGSSFA